MYKNYIKSHLDFSLALFLILFFLPIIIIIFLYLFIRIRSVIFAQKRPGLNNKIFTIYKFKTLIDKNVNTHTKTKMILFLANF